MLYFFYFLLSLVGISTIPKTNSADAVDDSNDSPASNEPIVMIDDHDTDDHISAPQAASDPQGGEDEEEEHDHTSHDVDPPIQNEGNDDAFVAAVHDQDEMHVHDMSSPLMSEHMAALSLVPREESTHTAINSGDWSDPDTWHNGIIPDDDAKVLIPEGIEVSYEGVSDVRLFTVRVDGKLEFSSDADSQIIVDTMVISPTGELVIGTQENPIDPDVSVDIIIADNGPIDTDWDTMLLSRGLISHGKATIHGSVKDSHEKVTEDPMAGDTSVSFAHAPEGWEVGDTIVIAGTHYDGEKWDNAIGETRFYPFEDEERVITSIEGNVVHFDTPLDHDHDAPRDDLATSVANYTRNVTISTENADDVEVFERGHVMFMHSDDVDVRYAAFHELGRTDKSVESQDVSDFDTIEFDSNVQGRYSLHLHRTGTEDLADPAMVVGNAVYGSPGWGFVHHDSNAVLENNASFDTFGAGYVAETGNETGLWSDNIAIQAQGIEWGLPKNTSDFDADTFDTARGGEGFWFQGRLVGSVDNIAASVNNGFVYFHRDGDDTMIEFDASTFAFPDAMYNSDSVTADDAPILVFQDNETFAAREGLHIVKANPNQGHDVWSHLEGFTAWSVTSGAHLQYTSHYLLEDFDVVGREDGDFISAETGISFGSNTSEIVILNANVDGFEEGIDLHKVFIPGDIDPENHNFVVIDATITGAEEDYVDYDPTLDTITTSDSLPNAEPNLDLTTLNFGYNSQGWGVEINGSKSDTLGETEFPGGTDDFRIKLNGIQSMLEENGYWTTSDGQTYSLADIYFTDRVTGEIYFETHPVFFDEDTAKVLGAEHWALPNAEYNGEQDFTVMHGTTYAGDRPIDKAQVAEPQTVAQATDAASSDHDLMSLLMNDQDVLSEEAGEMEEEMDDPHAAHAMIEA